MNADEPVDPDALYVATVSAYVELQGVRVKVVQRLTTVRGDHPLVEHMPDAFRMVQVSAFKCHRCPSLGDLPWCPEHAPKRDRRRGLVRRRGGDD